MSKFLFDLGGFALRVVDGGRVVYLLRGDRFARYDHLTLPFWKRRMWVHLTRRMRGGLEDRKGVGLVRRSKIQDLLVEFAERLKEHFLANVRPVLLDDLNREGYEVLMPADTLRGFVEGAIDTGVLSIEQFMEIGTDHVDRRPIMDAKKYEAASTGVVLGLVPPAGPDEERVIALYYFPGGVGSHGPGWFTYELGDLPQSILTALLRKHAGVRFLDWLLHVSRLLGIDVDREGIEAMRTEWSQPTSASP
jgi:hypothetical protein